MSLRSLFSKKKMSGTGDTHLSHEGYFKAFKESPDCIAISGLNGEGILEVNDAFERMTGYTREEAFGKTMTNLGVLENPGDRRLFLDLLLRDGIVRDFPYTLRRRSGDLASVLCSGDLIEVNGKRRVLTIHRDVTTQVKADTELRRLNRALQTIVQCHQEMIAPTTDLELMTRVCQVLVNRGGYRMAWVGLAEQDANRTVCPIASAGFESGYLADAQISWAEDLRGSGPVGTAIRTGAATTVRYMDNDPRFAPWREEALKRGYRSCIALPLMREDRVFGALTLYAEQSDAFDPEEARLLTELAEDLAYGIQSRQARAERIRAVEALQESEERFRALIEQAPVPIGISKNAVTIYVNQAYLQMYGFASAEEVVGHPIGERWSIESRKEVEERARLRSLGMSVPTTYEGIGLRNGDSTFNVLVTVTQVKLPDGLATLAFLRDITEQKKMLDALRESEQRYRTMFESSQDALVVVTPRNCSFVDANPAALHLFGAKDKMQLIDAEPWSLSRERQTDGGLSPGEGMRLLKDALEAGSAHSEWPLCRLNGEPFLAQVDVVSMLNGGERQLLATLRDITEKKRAEEALIRLSQAVDASGEVVLMTDAQGVITFVNPEFTRLYGYEADEVVGKTARRILKSSEVSEDEYAATWRTTLTENVVRSEVENRTKSGRRLTVEHSVTSVRDEQGNVIAFVSIQRDVTGRRQLEQQFLQAQKMEAIGKLAGGVAHDFNNILSIIAGYSELLMCDADLPERARQRLHEIKIASDRAVGVTQQLLAFSRKHSAGAKSVCLNSAVQQTTKMLARLLGEDINLITIFDPDLGTVNIDPAAIDQILLNLAVNARDAMPNGGTLTIETKNVSFDGDCPTDNGFLRPGEYVLLAVTDTGIGMDPETRMHIFEPFFTTKGARGTGLGLSTVFGLVEQSGGGIWTYSELGCGTTFKIYLERQVHRSGIEAAAPQALRGGGEAVLLVEDDAALRTLNVELIRSLGYTVLEAGNGAEALRIIEQHTGPLDVLITDIVMPIMNGHVLVDRALQLRPALKVLFVSGYTDNAGWEQIASPDAACLEKPFSRSLIAERIRALLDSAAEAPS